MRKTLLFLLIIFFSSSLYTIEKCGSLEYCIKKGSLDRVHSVISHEVEEGNIKDSTKPYKIKYCKAKDSEETFTTLKQLPCKKESV